MEKNKIRDYLSKTENKGLSEIELKDSTLKTNNCNDKIYAHIKIKDENILSAKWEGEGCSILNVSSSFITEKLNDIKEKSEALLFIKKFNDALESNKYSKEFEVFNLLEKHLSRKKCVKVVLDAFEEELKKV